MTLNVSPGPESKELRRPKEIFAEFDQTIQELRQLILAFDHEHLNTVPFAKSWTAGQLVRHVHMSSLGFVRLLNGPANDTTRKPDAMVAKIKADFLDFSTKMTSPDFVVPENIEYKKDDLLDSLAKVRSKFEKVIMTSDLTKTCSGTKLPVYGALTRLEAIYFIIYHTQRHLHQLRNIYQKVGSQK